MQLAHLIPHLDAEINRLQRARDLLALVPKSLLDLSAISAATTMNLNRPVRASLSTSASVLTATRERESTTEPDAQGPARSALDISPRKERRVRSTRFHTRAERRKPVVLEDTALRGSVPTGPVVVSAEEARKSQASKTAQASRAAEVRKAGADFISALSWRSRSTDTQNTDALLQRLMHLGEDGQDQQGPSPFELARGESFKESQAQLALKSQ